MKKYVIGLLVLAFLGYVGWRVYEAVAAAQKQEERRGPAAVAVEIAPVTRGDIRDIAQLTGSLQARSYFIVAPKVGGRLEKLYVDIGDVVERGALIAELDAAEYTEAVRQAEAELLVARANVAECKTNLDQSQREFERVKTLFDKDIASESELDTAQARFEAQQAKCQVAEAQVTQREAALKTQEVRLDYTRIRASWDGPQETRIIGERFVDQGAMLAANSPIVSIVDVTALTAIVNVIERDYSQINIGQSAVVETDAWPNRAFEGEVKRVAPLLQEASRQARVEIEIPNPDGLLKPGMFVRASIQLADVPGAVIVPYTAIVNRDGGTGVFLVNKKEKVANYVPVTLGISERDKVQIVSPAIEGDVVTLGQHLLEDGGAVILPDSEEETSSSGAKPEKTREGGRP